MALAETARLVTELQLRDQLSPGLAKARGELAGVNAASGATVARMGGLSSVTSGASAAFGTFRARIGGLLGVAGIAGLGAGLFSVTHLMSEGIQEAQGFGREVKLLAAVTGLSADQTSKLAGAFHHFGIESDTALRLAGFAEKNIGKLTAVTKNEITFEERYGFTLRNTSISATEFSKALGVLGDKKASDAEKSKALRVQQDYLHASVKDFNQVLLTSADYFNNKSIPAQTKAAALSQIYGRSWQNLIPILKAGRAGIAGAEEEAVKLGLTLTGANLAALSKLREATRSWGTALGGLKLQIGLALVPALTDLTNAATNFLAHGGREQIVGFFRQLVAFGRQAASTITGQVIPVFKGIYSAWMSVPKEVRDLLITGLVANKTIKFLFGVSPLDIGKGLLGTIGQQFFQRGSPGNPMFVVAEGGLGGAPGMGGGGLGSKLLLGGAAVAGGLFAGFNIGQWLNENYIGTGTGSVRPAKAFEAAGFTSTLAGGSSSDINRAIRSIEENLNPKDFGAQVAIALDINGVHSILSAQLAELRARLPAVVQAEAKVYQANLAEGARQSSWRARSAALLSYLNLASLAGNSAVRNVGAEVRANKLVSSAGLRALQTETGGVHRAVNDAANATRFGTRSTANGLGNVAGEVRRKKLSATANVHVINQNNISTYVQLAAAAVAYQVNLVRTSTKASNILHIL